MKIPTTLVPLLIGLSAKLQTLRAGPDLGPVAVADTTTAEGRVLKVLPTEVGYPEGIGGLVGVKPDDTARTEQMDGAFFVNEVCERLGLGWLQWQTETAEKWRGNIRLLIEDAKRNGYH